MANNDDSPVRAVIRVRGGVSGQIAAGNKIVQKLERHDGGGTATDADRADLRELLDALRARVAAESPPEQCTGALERVDELTDALTTEEPEIGTVRYVLGWFRKKAPALAGAVRDLILNPLVSRIVGAAGNVAAADFEQFLHDVPRI